MRRKTRKNKINPLVLKFIKYLTLVLVVIFVVVIALKKSITEIKNLDQFTVKEITIDPAISFIHSSQLSRLKGKNIFDIDLESVQKRLQHQYPQIAQLKVIKRYPNQIYVVAKRRNAFAQVFLKNRNFAIDEEGIILSHVDGIDKNLPLIKGVNFRSSSVRPGSQIKTKNIQVALKIIEAFKNNSTLASIPILRIDVGNLSQINLFVLNNFKIILDHEKVNQKLNILELLLSQEKVDLQDVRYIDLRFKEPIVRKK